MRDPSTHTRIDDHGASELFETDHTDGERAHIYLEVEPSDSPVKVTMYYPVAEPVSKTVDAALKRLEW